MTKPISESVIQLIDRAEARQPLGVEASPSDWVRPTTSSGKSLYSNKNDRLKIDFSVERAAFPEAQTVDPRIIEIAPGSCNERHKHAHESLFFVLEGSGEVLVGENWNPVKKGDLAFVPRWIMHQTRNNSEDEPMRVLAVTDFGFTSAVLGDYDRRTRLALAGADASA
ncbi:MAG: cupin domain-containing protein [Myxococcota bacterium]|jgi:quercetin dioxygenase-like cupin family protein|nr:cupin domain-containing protein [Myxococcota bacterium]